MPITATPAIQTQNLPEPVQTPGRGVTATGTGQASPPSAAWPKVPAAALFKAAAGGQPVTPPAGRYQRVVVIDSKETGISINPSDKVPDLTHGEVVRGIINTGINGSRQPGQAGHVPIELIAVENFASPDKPREQILQALRQVVQTAPRDAQNKPDLRGVAINLSQTVYGGSPLKPDERAVFQNVLAAGADLFVSESNITQGWPNHIGAVVDPPGGGRLHLVGGSDSKMFVNPDANVPSTQNPWSSFSNQVNAVANSDFLLRAVDDDGDGRTDGFDINGDGRRDFDVSQVKGTKSLEAPFVGRRLADVKVGLEDLQALEGKMEAEAAARIGRDPTLARETYEDQQRLLGVVTEIRDRHAATLKGKLLSVDDAMAFNLDADNKTAQTMSLGSLFRMDQHPPRAPALDPRQLYVSLDALLSGPREERYRDDLVFFTLGADGRVARVQDAPGMVGHLPSANSWAAPYALVTQFHRR